MTQTTGIEDAIALLMKSYCGLYKGGLAELAWQSVDRPVLGTWGAAPIEGDER